MNTGAGSGGGADGPRGAVCGTAPGASPRSYLYVPADQEDKLAKAARTQAAETAPDALVLDLEDAVAPGRKDTARANLRAWSSRRRAFPGQVWVRVDAGAVEADLAALAPGGVAGVVLPKSDPVALERLDALLTVREEQTGDERGSTPVLPLLETAEGMAAVHEVARAPRVHRMGMGEADLAAGLGLIPGPERSELAPLRIQVVLASAAAGLAPPVGSVETAVRDTERLLAGTRTLLRQGFRARTLLSPRQAAVVNGVFTPGAEEVRRARGVLAALERGGSGTALDERGGFVDEAVARAAREVLSRAGAVQGATVEEEETDRSDAAGNRDRKQLP